LAGAKGFQSGVRIGAGRQAFRSLAAAGGGFRDWLGPHDARVYRFSL
jgi:hypothetical protein